MGRGRRTGLGVQSQPHTQNDPPAPWARWGAQPANLTLSAAPCATQTLGTGYRRRVCQESGIMHEDEAVGGKPSVLARAKLVCRQSIACAFRQSRGLLRHRCKAGRSTCGLAVVAAAMPVARAPPEARASTSHHLLFGCRAQRRTRQASSCSMCVIVRL